MTGGRKTEPYDAFISYSHAADGRLAPAIQRGLQSLAKPWYRRRALRVFRDETSLSATPELWSTIEAALGDSRCFVLLASPDAAGSHWVGEEVSWWREHRPRGTLLLALTGGTLEWRVGASDFDWEETDALPPALRGFFDEEPLWVDLSWARESAQVSLRDPRFRERIADLAAPLRGLPKDDLIGEDVREHRRAVRLARGAVVTLVLLTAAAIVGGLIALDQRQEARAQADRAESRALAAEARPRFDRQLDLATLLSLEAFELSPTAEARSDVITALQRTERMKAVLRGHRGAVTAVAFSPAGGVLASGGSEGTVRRWSASTGRPRGAPLRGHRARVSAVAFAPDGETLASASEDDGTVRFWDPARGKALGEPLKFPFASPMEISFSPDGSRLAVATGVGMELFDVRTRQALGESPEPAGNVEHVAFDPDGKTLAAGALGLFRVQDGMLKLAKELAFPVRRHSVEALAFQPKGRLLAVSLFDGIDLRDGSTGRVVGRTMRPRNFQSALAFSPDGALLASADFGGGVVRLWDVRAREQRERFRGHIGEVTSVAFSPDGKTLASGGQDGTIRLWDPLARGALGRPLQGAHETLSTAISPDGKVIAAGYFSGTIGLWDVARRRSLGELEGHFEAVNYLAFTSDGRRLASLDDSGAVGLWDVTHRRALREPREVTGDPSQLALSPDGSVAAIKAAPGPIRLLDSETGRPVGRPFPEREGFLLDLFFTPDGETLVSVYQDGPTRLWDVAARRERGRPLAGVARALTPDGKTLALTTTDGAIRLTDVATGRALGRISTGASFQSLDDLAFSADGRTLAGTEAGALRLWDVVSRRALGEPAQTSARVVEFGPDGHTLVTAGAGSAPVLWNPLLWSGDGDRLAARLCPIVGRSLTRAEWEEFRPEAPYKATCG